MIPSLYSQCLSVVSESFDDGTLLYHLMGVVPPVLLNKIIDYHKIHCIRLVLGYYIHCGKNYCRTCIPRYRVPSNNYQCLLYLGPIQMPNWLRISNQYRCASCFCLLYRRGSIPSTVIQCTCAI